MTKEEEEKKRKRADPKEGAVVTFFKNFTDVQKARVEASTQKHILAINQKVVRKLESQNARLQHLVRDDIITLSGRPARYVSNKYKTYGTAVAEINKKYNATADFGVLQTGSIIDLRAAFIIGEGLKIIKKDKDANAEYDWVHEFLEYNDLDNEVVQSFASEAEIEGKIALKLALEETPESTKEKKMYMVSTRYVSWTENNYVIKANPQDYMQYETMTWKPKDKDKDEVLKEYEFVYKKFGGRVHLPNSATPKIMRCLTQIDNLDMALRDWREIDRVFAGPILGYEVRDSKDVKRATDALSDKNWKIKKVFVGMGKFYYASFDIKGVESLENEIVTLSKMISGATGVPVHFLGFPDLMSNRAVAENMMQLVHAATTKERATWKGAYEEVIAKSMALYNAEVNKGMSNLKTLDHKKIGVEIPMITREHWLRLEKVYLPAAVAGKISDESFQALLPGFDVEAEKKRKDEKEKSDFVRITKENEDLKRDLADKEIFGEETKPPPPEGEE